MLSNLSKMKKNPPKVVILSDFMLTFAMSLMTFQLLCFAALGQVKFLA